MEIQIAKTGTNQVPESIQKAKIITRFLGKQWGRNSQNKNNPISQCVSQTPLNMTRLLKKVMRK